MKYLFELSKEHKTLPISEVLSCLDAEKTIYDTVECNDDIVIIDTENIDIEKIANRLSMSYYIDEFLFSAKKDDIKILSKKNKIPSEGTVAVRCKNRSKNVNSKDIVKTLADNYTVDRKVNLSNPDIEIRVLITDKKSYVGVKKFEINRTQFENRKVQHRPFFSPISLHPKIARCLVNISKIKQEGILLDPFCGTGGILLEAGLIGIKVVGSDIENKMIEGCKKTLEHYNVKKFELFCTDIGDIDSKINIVDTVVTDLPYGKSTTTKGEDVKDLYVRSFEKISNILKNEGIAIMGISSRESIKLGEKYLKLLEIHEIKAHSSLTRYFAVFQNTK